MTQVATDAAHDTEHHDERLAHHFDHAQQQFDAGKLGIWIFLITEVLFFSGLFCAYAVYRSTHPELFQWGHQFLSVQMGAINTVVLLLSSLTMAWAVRCAQLNNKKGLVLNLAVTLVCAFTFLVIKYFEYSGKISHGLVPGGGFDPAGVAAYGEYSGHAIKGEIPEQAGRFFSIYYTMTGLHGIHVIGGIVVIFWTMILAMKGRFDSKFYGQVDYVALYWHLVDLVWIYLFPLLYLIH
jgi:cytochrome c oxidase subunit 3